MRPPIRWVMRDSTPIRVGARRLPGRPAAPMRLVRRPRASDSGQMRARDSRREIRQSRAKVQSRTRPLCEGASRLRESKFCYRGDASRLRRHPGLARRRRVRRNLTTPPGRGQPLHPSKEPNPGASSGGADFPLRPAPSPTDRVAVDRLSREISTLTRAGGAASPATKRARRKTSRAERGTLTRARYFLLADGVGTALGR